MTEHKLPDWVREGLSGLSVERELPKWPVLQVVGQDVRPELGREICLRTTRPGTAFSGGTDEWTATLAAAYGVTLDEHGWMSYEEEERVREELGILELRYLGNDRIRASRFDLPSGWCDWNGAIGTDGTHLGDKWPTLEGLNRELELIAQTWPGLAMTVQLSNYRDPERMHEYWPFLTWIIADGQVELCREPGFLLRPVRLPVAKSSEQLTKEAGRGVGIKTLRLAVNEVKEKDG
jgi:hypothetical protein